ncbi:Retrovirus-related Pol polyprotein from transposon RE1 [Vitis vinifera]|uniref:Retrovirus-related Pol polyprotein from transposon RE1 n=1 Tax=Vitis vinifera TaxID=29760 RepID=A0A438D8J5_VITVI|nr:Retrovirus-related Pol polyprotein from transposon RE1 [Vitis vinifera]
MSGTTLEPSSNDHLETKEVIEEGRDSTIKPSPPFEQFGFEDVFTEIPNQSSSVEGVLNLEPDPFMKRLPHRYNTGIPKPTYEPELSTKVKYLMSNYVFNHRLPESNKSFVNQLSTVAIPNSVQEALVDPRKKPIGCRWIYTVKYKADGSIERFKAILVAKGYTQTYGIDYTETFASVAKINTIRVLLSLAANLDWPLQQFDVKNVFLHGELSEEVYMDLPLGCMVSEKQCQKVCKLKKSLYGLKQSPRAWFERFTKSMRAFGYRKSGSLVTWKSKKQNVVARSSVEAEFRGMALGLCEALWLRLFLQDLGYLSRQPIRLFCDNKAACDIAHNPVQHDCTKHVEVNRFFIKEKLDDKIVELPKIRSEDQLVNILTKAAVSSRVF